MGNSISEKYDKQDNVTSLLGFKLPDVQHLDNVASILCHRKQKSCTAAQTGAYDGILLHLCVCITVQNRHVAAARAETEYLVTTFQVASQEAAAEVAHSCGAPEWPPSEWCGPL